MENCISNEDFFLKKIKIMKRKTIFMSIIQVTIIIYVIIEVMKFWIVRSELLA